MTRTVYTGAEVPHVFAANKFAIARNSNDSLHCANGVLRSYREPIAAYIGEQLFISTDTFSVTTSKHQSWANYALHHIESIRVSGLRDLVENTGQKSRVEWIAKRAKQIAELQDSKSRMRAEWKIRQVDATIHQIETACDYVWRKVLGKRSEWRNALNEKAKADKANMIRRYTSARNRLEAGLENAQRMLSDARDRIANDPNPYHALQHWWILDGVRSDILRLDEMGARHGFEGFAATATFCHAAKLMGKKWARECVALAKPLEALADSLQPECDLMRAEYDKREALDNAEKIAEWKAGKRSGHIPGPVHCRVIGDTVETSKGARVPLSDALAVTELAKQCRDTGRELDLRNRAIGPYRGNRIASNGDLHIGCHHITWEAIADCVARYEESEHAI